MIFTGWGDMTYNSLRNILCVIPLQGKIAYHLFNAEDETSINLSRRPEYIIFR
jgi:hypothetical protein